MNIQHKYTVRYTDNILQQITQPEGCSKEHSPPAVLFPWLINISIIYTLFETFSTNLMLKVLNN